MSWIHRGVRRARAELHYAAHALRVLARPLVGMVVVVVLGAWVHHDLGGANGVSPSWSQSFFVSYCLLFFEHIEPIPSHPIAQLVHYGQPVVGLILVSEGILRLGLQLLDREANARIWMSIMADTTSDHVVVCGLGSVGFRITEELRRMGIEVFAIDNDPDCIFLERARDAGARVQVGDARAENLLRSLNIERARAVIIATDDDLANLEIAMDVREIRRDVHLVMRMFDQRLAKKVKQTLGVDVSVSTSRLAAPLFASAALDPSVVGTHRVGDTVLVVLQVTVALGSSLQGHTIDELGSQGLTVVAKREGATWALSPPSAHLVVAGEELQILVPSTRVQEVHRLSEA